TGSEGDHGEDVKELYYYLDSTPTHSYMKALYKYPQAEFPYAQLLEENRRRGLGARSEEHTSELQSRGHLVCRLLLEKKKIKHSVGRVWIDLYPTIIIPITSANYLHLYNEKTPVSYLLPHPR